jgi:hypothetical protein
VRLQQARLVEAVAFYQETVLKANQEAEDGLVAFLKAQQRARSLKFSADEAQEAVKLVLIQYQKGTVDFTRVTQLQLTLVQQQDSLAQAQGEIARGLVQLYKGLGGGWDYHLPEAHPGARPAARLGPPQDLPPAPATPGDGGPGHSPPTCSPFSATERFMNGTSSTSATARTAPSQNTSK